MSTEFVTGNRRWRFNLNCTRKLLSGSNVWKSGAFGSYSGLQTKSLTVCVITIKNKLLLAFSRSGKGAIVDVEKRRKTQPLLARPFKPIYFRRPSSYWMAADPALEYGAGRMRVIAGIIPVPKP